MIKQCSFKFCIFFSTFIFSTLCIAQDIDKKKVTANQMVQFWKLVNEGKISSQEFTNLLTSQVKVDSSITNEIEDLIGNLGKEGKKIIQAFKYVKDEFLSSQKISADTLLVFHSLVSTNTINYQKMKIFLENVEKNEEIKNNTLNVSDLSTNYFEALWILSKYKDVNYYNFSQYIYKKIDSKDYILVIESLLLEFLSTEDVYKLSLYKFAARLKGKSIGNDSKLMILFYLSLKFKLIDEQSFKKFLKTTLLQSKNLIQKTKKLNLLRIKFWVFEEEKLLEFKKLDKYFENRLKEYVKVKNLLE